MVDAKIAETWATLSAVSKAQAHPSNVSLFANSTYDSTPFFGFVGKDYDTTKLLFVARNGAVGKTAGDLSDNKKMYELTRNLASAPQTNCHEAFDALMDLIGASMLRWPVYRYVADFLKKGEMTQSHIGYLNLVAFRSSDQNLPSLVFKEAWQNYTGQLVTMLAPRVIVPLGTAAAYWIPRLYSGAGTVTRCIRRTRGDRYISPDGQKDIRDVLATYRNLSPH